MVFGFALPSFTREKASEGPHYARHAVATDILDTPEAGPTAIRGAAVRVGGYFASVALSVISAAVLLRYLGAQRFGQYTTIFSLMTIVMGVAEAGTTQIGVREYAVRAPDERASVLGNLQGLRVVLTIAGVFIALVFALLAGYTDQMVLGAALYGAGLVVTVVALTLTIPLQAEIRLVAVSLLELLRQGSTVVVLLLLVAAGAGVAAFLSATIPVGILLLVATLLVVRRTVPLRISVDPAEWRRLLADTLPYAAAIAIGVLYSYVTILLMSLVATETETGYFGAAHRIFYVLTQVPGLVVAAAFPVLARAARDDHERLRYAIQRLFEVLLLTGAGMGLLVAAGAPAAIEIVAGSDYGPAIPVLRLQGIALAATALIALGSFGLLSLRRHTALLVCNAAGLLVTSVLTLILASDRGAEGAAVALVIGEAVLGTTLFVTLSRSAHIRPSLAIVPKVAVATALAAVPGLMLGLPAVPAAAAAAVVYAGAVFALRAVPPELTEAFTGRLGRGTGPRTPPPSEPS
jgi:O-antigen/teichoic acid export membrane protein